MRFRSIRYSTKIEIKIEGSKLTLLPQLISRCCPERGPQVLGLLFVLNAGKYHLLPGIFSFGSLMYSLKVSSFHTIPEFLLASK